MGCGKSAEKEAKLQEAIREQTLQIEHIKRTNEEMRRMMSGIVSVQETMRTQNPEDLEVQLIRLESKLIQLTEKVSLRLSSNTLSRNDTCLKAVGLPIANPEPLKAEICKDDRESVWDDPIVREMLEKRREKFQKKRAQDIPMNSSAAHSPTAA